MEENTYHNTSAEETAPLSDNTADLNKWSWGAFMFSLIWGIGNRVWISLLAIIPVLNIIMMFVLGFKGKQWAWETGRWKSIEELNASQSTWDFAGKVSFALLVLGIILGAVLGISAISQIQDTLQQSGSVEFNMDMSNTFTVEE